MDITPYVESLRQDLLTTAEAGGAETRAAAERLLPALEPAVRLALMDALSQAAAEITSELPAGAVEVRLRGREPELVVDVPAAPAAAPLPPEDEDDGGETLARITVRIPESVKARAEELAARSGRSLNSWIVGALRAATRERVIDIDLSGTGPRQRGRRMTGWV
ncbi:toxin-antitoxin system HicB family antitoxin [Georgenia thermotolerans]|uniref:Toxin-antitoxin system HicB family antitoxin n=1 Tax=Georgenia thermotolerans TaxID=527326 RepID=A0A7J5UT09_9MICO|nr:toxin-antitoxin system HicB family antitoxin [Georgenia thermotolerans]KAE8765488.1 toxin-antitoxin system HicB family antitoxin [Georgenia thermotolerans]